MSQGTLLPLTLEEDLGLSNLATKNDQRTSVSFCHLELIRFELAALSRHKQRSQKNEYVQNIHTNGGPQTPQSPMTRQKISHLNPYL